MLPRRLVPTTACFTLDVSNAIILNNLRFLESANKLRSQKLGIMAHHGIFLRIGPQRFQFRFQACARTTSSSMPGAKRMGRT